MTGYDKMYLKNYGEDCIKLAQDMVQWRLRIKKARNILIAERVIECLNPMEIVLFTYLVFVLIYFILYFKEYIEALYVIKWNM
jgi:hypothetical protein